MSEHVVLLDEKGNAVGTAPKTEVHHRSTPLHLAFSCYLFDGDGFVLVTRRAWHKPTWPGVWTNSVCGHPAPGEGIAEAVARRVREELRLDVQALQLALPAFRYQAVMDDGVRENEMCPVFTALASGTVRGDPDEVAEAVWEPWTVFRDGVLGGGREVSPWCRQQVSLLADLGVDGRSTGDWGADASALPPAARSPSVPPWASD
jgi:isopentenyl-diphosphate delta-isomerase